MIFLFFFNRGVHKESLGNCDKTEWNTELEGRYRKTSSPCSLIRHSSTSHFDTYNVELSNQCVNSYKSMKSLTNLHEASKRAPLSVSTTAINSSYNHGSSSSSGCGSLSSSISSRSSKYTSDYAKPASVSSNNSLSKLSSESLISSRYNQYSSSTWKPVQQRNEKENFIYRVESSTVNFTADELEAFRARKNQLNSSKSVGNLRISNQNLSISEIEQPIHYPKNNSRKSPDKFSSGNKSRLTSGTWNTYSASMDCLSSQDEVEQIKKTANRASRKLENTSIVSYSKNLTRSASMADSPTRSITSCENISNGVNGEVLPSLSRSSSVSDRERFNSSSSPLRRISSVAEDTNESEYITENENYKNTQHPNNYSNNVPLIHHANSFQLYDKSSPILTNLNEECELESELNKTILPISITPISIRSMESELDTSNNSINSLDLFSDSLGDPVNESPRGLSNKSCISSPKVLSNLSQNNSLDLSNYSPKKVTSDSFKGTDKDSFNDSVNNHFAESVKASLECIQPVTKESPKETPMEDSVADLSLNSTQSSVNESQSVSAPQEEEVLPETVRVGYGRPARPEELECNRLLLEYVAAAQLGDHLTTLLGE